MFAYVVLYVGDQEAIVYAQLVGQQPLARTTETSLEHRAWGLSPV